jgi:hypothetical protein
MWSAATVKPAIRNKLDKLDTAIYRLEAVLKDKQEIIVEQQDEREKLLRDQWIIKREAATAARDKTAREELEKVNHRLREDHEAVRDQLRNVLEKVKTLSEAMRP